METFVPFTTLPPCAGQCGALYDANGACAPIGVTSAPSAIASCFCANAKVAPLSTGTAGVCDSACAANPKDFGNIRNWFTSFCANPATITNLGLAGGSTSTSLPIDNTKNGDWLSTHWQWVVMIVIMVVGISGIWIGACVWRRRYLRKRDRQYALGKRLGAAGVGSNAAAQQGIANAAAGNALTRPDHVPAAGMFEAAPISSAACYGPETEKEKRNRMSKKPKPTEATT